MERHCRVGCIAYREPHRTCNCHHRRADRYKGTRPGSTGQTAQLGRLGRCGRGKLARLCARQAGAFKGRCWHSRSGWFAEHRRQGLYSQIGWANGGSRDARVQGPNGIHCEGCGAGYSAKEHDRAAKGGVWGRCGGCKESAVDEGAGLEGGFRAGKEWPGECHCHRKAALRRSAE